MDRNNNGSAIYNGMISIKARMVKKNNTSVQILKKKGRKPFKLTHPNQDQHILITQLSPN